MSPAVLGKCTFGLRAFAPRFRTHARPRHGLLNAGREGCVRIAAHGHPTVDEVKYKPVLADQRPDFALESGDFVSAIHAMDFEHRFAWGRGRYGSGECNVAGAAGTRRIRRCHTQWQLLVT